MTKPTADSFDPNHLQELQEAKSNLGNYKLKSSSSYIVPEHMRMNVAKQKKHMYLLEEFIYNTKLKFNQEVSNLKQRKINLIENIK